MTSSVMTFQRHNTTWRWWRYSRQYLSSLLTGFYQVKQFERNTSQWAAEDVLNLTNRCCQIVAWSLYAAPCKRLSAQQKIASGEVKIHAGNLRFVCIGHRRGFRRLWSSCRSCHENAFMPYISAWLPSRVCACVMYLQSNVALYELIQNCIDEP